MISAQAACSFVSVFTAKGDREEPEWGMILAQEYSSRSPFEGKQETLYSPEALVFLSKAEAFLSISQAPALLNMQVPLRRCLAEQSQEQGNETKGRKSGTGGMKSMPDIAKPVPIGA